MHTMGPIDVSLALAIFHERHPGVELSVREQSSEELAEMLRDDVLDLAFLSVTERIEATGSGSAAVRRGAGRDPPSDTPCAAATACGSPTGRRAVHQLPGGARLRELLNFAARDADFDPRVTLESNESQRIRRLVARGLGVSILPRSDADRPGAEVVVVGADRASDAATSRSPGERAAGWPPRRRRSWISRGDTFAIDAGADDSAIERLYF